MNPQELANQYGATYTSTSVGDLHAVGEQYGAKFTPNENAAGLGATTAAQERLMAARQAQQEAVQQSAEDNSLGGTVANTVEGLAPAAVEVGKDIVKSGAKFGVSALASPVDLVRGIFGKGGSLGLNNPLFGSKPLDMKKGSGLTSYQQDAEGITGEVFDGTKTPLQGTADAVLPVLEGAGTVLGAEGAANSLIKSSDRIASTVSKGAKTVGNVAKELSQTNYGEALPKGYSKPNPATSRAVEAITPKARQLSPTEYSSELNRGNIKPKTFSKPAQVVPDEKKIELANKYGDLLQGKDTVKNFNNVMEGIANRDKEVGTFFKNLTPEQKFNQSYNQGELKNYLMKRLEGVTDISVPNEARVEHLKSSVVDDIISRVPKKDLEGLWNGRKDFDQFIDKKFKAFNGSPTLKKEISREVRNGAQDFISEKLGDKFYSNKMKEMSDLYKVKDLLDTKATAEKGKSVLMEWVRDNPGKAKALSASGILGAEEALIGGIRKNIF